MASAEVHLRKETECPLCLETFVNPKVVGSCLHTLCLDCATTYLERHRGKRDFSCPICRQNCRFPPNGADGLKDNFTMANFIEIADEMRREEDSKPTCTVCENKIDDVAKAACCSECVDLVMCASCGIKHSKNHGVGGHERTGLCATHRKPLKMYCQTSGQGVCDMCVGSHAEHELKSFRDLFVEARARFARRKNSVADIRKNVDIAWEVCDKVRREASHSVASVRADVTNQHREAKDRVATRIRVIDDEVAKLDKERRGLVRTNTKLDKSHEDLMSEIHDNSQKQTKAINSFVSALKSVHRQLKSNVEQGKYLVSNSCLWTAETYKGLTEVETGFSDIIAEAEKLTVTTPITDLLDLVPMFVAERKTSFRLGSLEKKRSSEATFCGQTPTQDRYIASKLFTMNLTYETTPPSICSLVSLSEQRVAVLAGTPTSNTIVCDSIMVYSCGEHGEPGSDDKDVGLSVFKTIKDNVGPAVHMVADDKGRLVLFRTESPFSRIIDIDSGEVTDVITKWPQVSLCHPSKIWRGDVDTDGRSFVLERSASNENRLVAFDNRGKYLQIQILQGSVYSDIACCRMSGCVYALGQWGICQYRVVDDTPVGPRHCRIAGIEGFQSECICVRDQELFILGRMMDDGEMRLYHGVKQDSGKGWEWNALQIDFGEKLKPCYSRRLSVVKDQLVISQDMKITMFKLHRQMLI